MAKYLDSAGLETLIARIKAVINTIRQLPSVSTSDNGKILMVTNGSWSAQSIAMQQYYTGSSSPANTLGENGDLYLQT